MDDKQLPEALILGQDELHFLLQLAGRTALLGLDPKPIAGPAPKSGREQLLSRGLIQPGQNGANDRVQGAALMVLTPVLFPKRALMAARSLPGTGSQTVVLYANGPGYVLHSMVEGGKHSFQPLTSPAQLIPALLEWFPITSMPGVADQAIIATAVLDKCRELAQGGQVEKALNTILHVPLDDAQKRLLVKAMHDVKVSGSFALVVFGPQASMDVESLAIVADDQTAWAFTVPAEASRDSYRVRRTGDDFPLILRRMCDWLSGEMPQTAP